MKKLNKKGFTLAELLIVVAIIAVLVAISIPIFTAQLEKAREATDAANLRAAYAELMADALTTSDPNSVSSKSVSQRQTVSGWDTSVDFPANFSVAAPQSGAGSWTVGLSISDGVVQAVEATH